MSIIIHNVTYVYKNRAVNHVVKCSVRREVNHKRQTDYHEARAETQKILPNIFERARVNQKYRSQQDVAANRQAVGRAQKYTRSESQSVNKADERRKKIFFLLEIAQEKICRRHQKRHGIFFRSIAFRKNGGTPKNHKQPN